MIEKAEGRLTPAKIAKNISKTWKHRKEKFKYMLFMLEATVLLEGCKDHPNGCYIRFRSSKITSSEPRSDVVIDYDKDGKIVGIEFYEGLRLKKCLTG